jgi:hypothetical protein
MLAQVDPTVVVCSQFVDEMNYKSVGTRLVTIRDNYLLELESKESVEWEMHKIWAAEAKNELCEDPDDLQDELVQDVLDTTFEKVMDSLESRCPSRSANDQMYFSEIRVEPTSVPGRFRLAQPA